MDNSEEYYEHDEIDKKVSTEYLFKFSLGLLSIFGLIMVYSSSYIYAKEVFHQSYYFIMKQAVFMTLGLGLCFMIAKTKFTFWFNNTYKLHILLTLLLLATFMPVLGLSMKGSHRWINLGVLTLQPGEFVKYSMLFTSYKFFKEFFEYEKNEKIVNGVILLFPLSVMILQPDFGSFSISAFAILLSCFLSDFPRKWFYAALGFGTLSVIGLIFTASYRLKRFMTFLDPWKDPKNSGFQIIQSYLAFANGSLFGQGIGNSSEKLFYLPEAYNDFIFSVVGEELGFLGVTLVVLTFLWFTYLGLKIAMQKDNKAVATLMASIVILISFQALLNMGVVLGLLPTKGLNLPFISYGGSSLIANFAVVGFYFSLNRKGMDIKNSRNQQRSNNHIYSMRM